MLKMDFNYEDDEEFNRLSEAASTLFSYKQKTPEKQEITMQLIIKRNLISTKTNPTLMLSSRSVVPIDEDMRTAKSIKAEEQAEKLLKLTHIHLDRENIVMIDNLAEYLGPITNLYLQHNLIERIENLEFLTNLKFLVLSNNQIEKIENLKCLKKLKFLDLSFNLIQEFNVEELPSSLIILDLRLVWFLLRVQKSSLN
jgi:Leucine-rich repeat (LRR) protein